VQRRLIDDCSLEERRHGGQSRSARAEQSSVCLCEEGNDTLLCCLGGVGVRWQQQGSDVDKADNAHEGWRGEAVGMGKVVAATV
jgi:hypothetical protein